MQVVTYPDLPHCIYYRFAVLNFWSDTVNSDYYAEVQNWLKDSDISHFMSAESIFFSSDKDRMLFLLRFA